MSDNYMQTSIFDMLYKEYKIEKPIRLIELFAGYGSQYFALKYINANVEHYKICEWAVKSIQAYNDAHVQDYTDYSKEFSDGEIIDKLVNMGISINYNDPATKEQIKRKRYRKIYNNVIATNNLVNIQNAKGEDFEIKDKEKFTYLLTYSFPCQDLSLAGLRKGMCDTTTRSGMLWEVERILKELKEKEQLPDILLMENVPQVHSQENVADFNKWQYELEKMGYKNYFQDLIATDYGIPQTRNRCFMVSILGDYVYNFPPKQKLEIKLKDMLENEVDEKYYLSDKQIKDIKNWNAYQKPLENMQQIEKQNLCPTITTRSGAYSSSIILVKDEDGKNIQMNCRTWKQDKVIGTYQYSKSDKFMQGKPRLRIGKEVIDTILTTQKEGIVNNDLTIRKLTPKECFRLMGVKDSDFEKIAKNQSESSLYHLAGDSIVVNVLMAIFLQFFKN